jgi:hypothetical protein
MSYDAAPMGCCGARGDDAGKDHFPNLTYDDQKQRDVEVQDR